MRLTAIHLALGEVLGELTSEMLDDAVGERLREGQQLDWKRQVPEGRPGKTELAKDLAAMANADGGLVVYGVNEEGSAAMGREDVELTEGLERQIRAIAASAVMPPLLGLEVEQVGDGAPRAVAVQVPRSEDAPHLISATTDSVRRCGWGRTRGG